MAATFREQLDCPICFKILEQEIYHCKNGHTFCDKCEKHLSLCPQCNVHVGKPRIRCQALENILNKMTFDCDYKAAGCVSKLSRTEITNHRETCSYGEKIQMECRQIETNRQEKVTQTANFQGQNAENLKTASTSNIVTFENVTCNSCLRNPITDMRFKCLKCPNFDLCKNCVSPVDHSHSVFVVMKTVDKSSQAREGWERWSRYLEGPNAFRSGWAEPVPPQRSCFTCSSMYVSYICLNCKQLADYCEACFAGVGHSESHLFAYVRDSEKPMNVFLIYTINFSAYRVIWRFVAVFFNENKHANFYP